MAAEAGTLADAYLRLRADVSQLGKEIDAGTAEAAGASGEKAGKSFADRFGISIKRLATTLIASFAGFELIDLTKEAVEGAESFEQAERLTAAAIKSTGGAANLTAEDVANLSVKLSNLSGVHEDVVQSGADVLLTFTQIRNEAGKGNDIFDQTLQAALDVSAGLHQNLQPSIIQIGKALNDPITGMTTLRRIGISFTQDQINQAQALEKSGNLLGAQKLILAELSKEFGGAAAAAVDSGDKSRNAWHNFIVDLGREVLPLLDQVRDGFAGMLPTLEKVASNVLGVVVATTKFFTENKNLLYVLLATVGVLGTLSTAIDAVKAAHKAWLVVTLAEDAALDANVIGVIVIAIAALVAGIIYAYTHFKVFRDIVNGAWGGIKVGFEAIVTAGQRVAQFFTRDIPAAWSKVYESTVRTYQRVRDAVVGALDAAVSFIESLPSRILRGLEALPGLIGRALLAGIDALLFGIGYAIGTIIKLWETLPGEIAHIVVQLWDGAVTLTAIGIANLISWFEALPGRALRFVRQLWSDAQAAFVSGEAAVINFLISLPGRVGKIFDDTRDWAVRSAINLVQGFVGWVQRLPGEAVSALSSLGSSIQHALSAADTWLYDAGKAIINGLIHGVEDAIGGAIDAVKHGMGKILDGAKSALGIKSPSKVFADEVGRWIPAGIQQGIDRADDLDFRRFFRGFGPPPAAGATANGSAGGGGGLNIENFYATPEQSPAKIAHELAWLAKGGG